jgi:hypothetical protein
MDVYIYVWRKGTELLVEGTLARVLPDKCNIADILSIAMLVCCVVKLEHAGIC